MSFKSIVRRISPAPVRTSLRRTRHTLLSRHVSRARKAFDHASNIPPFLDYQTLVRLDKKYPSTTDYRLQEDGFSEQRGTQRAKSLLKSLSGNPDRYQRTLEIGCGKGENLEILSSLGIDSCGIEYGEGSISHLNNLGLNATRMFFETGLEEVPGAPYDGFIFLNFLEHLPRPREVFAGIRKSVKSEAFGLIEVPNFDMILEESLFTEFVSDHIFYFSQDSLETALRNNGFDVIDCRETWHRYTLTAIVKKRRGVDFSDMAHLTDSLKKVVGEFCEKYCAKGIAVWGAGHQALTVMAITEISDKVKYVVDSAPFKQNHFTPGTHIPIVSPDVLFSDSIGTVLVIAGSYTNEVCEIIRCRNKETIDIAVLEGGSIKLVGKAGPTSISED